MAVTFHTPCNSTTEFSTIGANTTVGGNNGIFGGLGTAGSLRITASGAAYPFEGVQKALPANATIFQFYVRPASTVATAGGVTMFACYVDAAYTNATMPIRIDLTPVTTSTYKLSLIDPTNGYATTTGTTVFTTGVVIRLVLQQTSSGWNLYVNNTTTPEIAYAKAQTLGNIGWIVIGQLYQNAVGSSTGIFDYDDLYCGTLDTTPTTTAGKTLDAYNGYLQNHLSAEGMPYRGPVDGNNLTYTGGNFVDSTSETAAYMLKLAVQNNDQANFILCDNFVLANMLRSKSTVANTTNNAAPTTALNLMVFHYNSANTDGKGNGSIYDANWAGDADPERAQALLWAHARFGSSANAVGSDLVAPNYLQRALNVINDLRTYAFSNSTATGYNYLLNDSLQQGNTVVQIGPDYLNPAAFKLFAQYDSANATFWNNAILGAYDLLNKAAAQVMTGATPTQLTTSGLNPNWIAFTVATATTSGTPSTYGDSDYGFNSFRTHYRLYDVYNWYADASSLTPQRQAKTFWANEWSVNAKIRATFKHDGTNTGTYEITLFTYAAYWSLYTGDTGNTTASAINTGKLANLYYQAAYGSIISDSPTSASYGYFGQSWSIIGYMQQAGTWINYGQSAGVVVNHNALLLLGVG